MYLSLCSKAVLSLLGTLVIFLFQIGVSRVTLREQYKMFIVLAGIMDQELEFKVKMSWTLGVNTAILKLRSQNKPLRKWERFLRTLKKYYYLKVESFLPYEVQF